ncbi:ribose transport system permease protein [Inquilinus ginsengisoli]|jgi:ribose transport system permease protein|uniref:Ribose transport system permease protein n=1 Tax=Inquilinus ginsengisoli TaxID=363840 RepID=A0ABU1K192_9PROT|nr:ABC transporter permease [Inquilinus ginsengisoli]MDR6294637.1 ribose transport system permease protein [Inquilinus ginsengisoli]
MTAFLRSVDRPILVACGFVILILMAGTAYTMITQGTATFLSPTYLLQQLKVASFMGVIAAGMMLVILMGHIDLSVPWTITASAMLATAVGGPEAIPVGLGVGMLVGLFNGLGVAFLRVPSMIFTLGVNTVLRGLMVMLTGGFSPTSMATPPMEFLAKTELLGIPMAVFVWILLSLALVFLLTRMPMGRYIYAIGNREAAAYLSGVNTRLVIVGGFVLCGFCAALAGILLAGYSSKAYQAMGDTYLLPSIAAVVIGGTNILGGQGRYAGTVVGTILIVLLQSVLSVMQMPEAGRQIIYGLVIILMLVLYGRGGRAAT